ncbi:NAD(P)/FAD-dependent oxidoreductase [Brevibacterium album]|uniref:NAD(P)/FAD-dependent oxidoreductase n=1 Tax=Brevibacterium album TaxID=417948 RepID=UPI00041F6BC5|nr:FAD-dependent oxidoreductase [Brevibacterium album]
MNASAEQQDRFDYVIAGAGVAAASAATAIREADPDGTIALIGREDDGPFYRPDLSKTLWLDPDAKLDSGWLLEDEVGAELLTGTSVTAVDTEAHTLTLSDTRTLGYGQLLLATGAEPRSLDLPESPRILTYRTVADYRRLRELAAPGARIVVVGGGYIGAEVSAALNQNGASVTLIMPGTAIQESMFPEALARMVTDAYRERGVELVTGTRATGAEATGETVTVTTGRGGAHTAEAVVVGAGVIPNDQVARLAGITVDDGIVVDAHLATSAPDVWAAGDVARYPDALLGVRRVEHVDNAEHQGATAGRNMAAARTGRGTVEAYAYTPIFWSDLFDYGYEAVGELSARLDTTEDFTDDHSAGIVYYSQEDHVRGALLWNVWDSTDRAKALIAQTAAEPKSGEELRGSIALE